MAVIKNFQSREQNAPYFVVEWFGEGTVWEHVPFPYESSVQGQAVRSDVDGPVSIISFYFRHFDFAFGGLISQSEGEVLFQPEKETVTSFCLFA